MTSSSSSQPGAQHLLSPPLHSLLLVLLVFGALPAAALVGKVCPASSSQQHSVKNKNLLLNLVLLVLFLVLLVLLLLVLGLLRGQRAAFQSPGSGRVRVSGLFLLHGLVGTS